MTNKRIPEEQHFVLATLSPSPAQKRLAFAVVCGIVVVFALITVGPLKGVQLGRVDAFVPAYVTAMFVFDFITALLLFAQFVIVRLRATLVVANAYLFAALGMIAFILVFPGVFVPGRGLVGGMQSTSWIYFFLHAGFPLFLIGYAWLKDRESNRPLRKSRARRELVLSMALTSALVLAGAWIFIAAEPLLLRVTLDSTRFGPLWWYPAAPVALLNVVAIVVLWTRRRVALDYWLMVVALLYAIEIPLSYFPDPQRFSAGWYAVRVFGVVSSSVVLMLLMYEITTLYARLLQADLAHRRERAARLMTGGAVAASIAHEVRQPLTAMVTTADAGFRFLDRPAPNLDRAKEAFRRITADGHRAGDVVESIRATFRGDAQDRTPLNLDEVIEDALELGRADLRKHGIVVQARPRGQGPDVRGNRVQLEQVLLNLILNAVDAMAARDEPRILSIQSESYQGDHVMVSVADTGAGIDMQDADRIFTPLFTTKAGGMGMGLAICRAIIETHRGRLWFTPNVPHGAVFRFTLHSGDLSTAAVVA